MVYLLPGLRFCWAGCGACSRLLVHGLSFSRTEILLGWLWGLFAIDLFGVALANCINLAVVLNYSIQCEMLRYYIQTLRTRLRERSTSLRAVMRVGRNTPRKSISTFYSLLF